MQKYLKIKPGLKLPLTFDQEGSSPPAGYGMRFRAVLNVMTRKYEIERMTVVRGDGPPLNGTMLRTVRVQDFLEDAMRKVPIQRGNDEAYEWPYAREMAVDGSTVTWTPMVTLPVGEQGQDARVRYAAEVYAISAAFGLPELRGVMRALAVSQSTATRLVRQARERGLLDVA